MSHSVGAPSEPLSGDHSRSSGRKRARVAVLGSTGSVGASALRVIERHPDRFEVAVLAANRSVDTLAAQAERHPSARVIVGDEEAYRRCDGVGEGWSSGRECLLESVARDDVDVVVNALVGFLGLEPSLEALSAGKRLALANKESLVAGGELMVEALRSGGGRLVPIDSEHSAVMQCLAGRSTREVHRVVLTASGGPFRGRDVESLAKVAPDEALRHPTWEMGNKITVDSATLANKALEVIEAHFLYAIDYDRIEAVVHPQSIVHSWVEYVDGSVLAQLGFPNMELPILQALSSESVPDSSLRTFDPMELPPLTFEPIDTEAFPLFEIGCRAGRQGGLAPTVFNAANEVAVAAFLVGDIPFPAIAEVVGEAVSVAESRSSTDLEAVLRADEEARYAAESLVRDRRSAVKG